MDVVGADVLGYASGLAPHDVRLSYGVKQRRLAVVDVPHDRDDRGTGFKVDRSLLLDNGRAGLKEVFPVNYGAFGLVAVIGRYERHGVSVYKLVDRGHDAKGHELFDYISGLDAKALRQVSDADGFDDPYDPLGGLGNGYLRLL